MNLSKWVKNFIIEFKTLLSVNSPDLQVVELLIIGIGKTQSETERI